MATKKQQRNSENPITNAKRKTQERLGDNIKNLRKDKRMSQVQLASAIDETQSAISGYEAYKTVPPDALAEISKVFGVSADYLLGLSKVKTTDVSIQSIHRKIHLSEESINRLSKDEKIYQNEDVISFINDIINYKDLRNLARSYCEYIKAYYAFYNGGVQYIDFEYLDESDNEAFEKSLRSLEYQFITAIVHFIDSSCKETAKALLAKKKK